MICLRILLLGLAFTMAVGCDKGPSFNDSAKRDLMLLGLEIHNTKPTSQAELAAKSADAKKILDSNNYVYLPGLDMNLPNAERSQVMVAYHKDTPTKGGYVLNGDGSVILLTKELFESAKKPEALSGESAK